MPIARIEIQGYRGFATPASMPLAIPNGKPGSGLTILVGANNTGKSSVIEALQFLRNREAAPLLGDSRRNASSIGRVDIRYYDDHDAVAQLGTAGTSGSTVQWHAQSLKFPANLVWAVPSRRQIVDPNVQGQVADRANHAKLGPPEIPRYQQGTWPAPRLLSMDKNRDALNKVLEQLVDPVPAWYLEPVDNQRSTLRVAGIGGTHTSEGMGEGFMSLLFIADALYDSEPGSLILLDQPEASLNMPLEQRLRRLLSTYAKDRQIVYATHSPYFTEWPDIWNGAQIVRTFLDERGCALAALRPSTAAALKPVGQDRNNPHALGVDAREVLFLEDRVILVEGQEDVISFREIIAQLDLPLHGEFYGWGVGGASKMRLVAQLLVDLGFKHVAGILDLGQQELQEALGREFSRYRFFLTSMRDVRTKPAERAKPARDGLLDENFRLRADHVEHVHHLFDLVNGVLRPPR